MKRSPTHPAPAADALRTALGGAMSVTIAAAHVLYHEAGGLGPGTGPLREQLLASAPDLLETAGDVAGDRRAAIIFAKHAVTQSAPRALLEAGRSLAAEALVSVTVATPAEALAAMLLVPDVRTLPEDPDLGPKAENLLPRMALLAARAALDAYARGELPTVGIEGLRAALCMFGLPEALGLLALSRSAYSRMVVLA